MANTYTQLYVHVVFAVKGRANLISKNWKEKLYQYITGIITHKNQKLMVAKFNEQEVLLAYSKSGIVALAKKEKEIKAPVIKPLSVVPGPQDTQFSRTSFNQLFKDTESMRESSRDTDGILKLKEAKKMRQS